MQDEPVARVTGATKESVVKSRKDLAVPRLHRAHRVAQPRAWGDGREERRSGCPRPTVRRQESGLHRSRGRAHPGTNSAISTCS
jgi:hypothetical protein